MNNINRMINKTIIDITIFMLILVASFWVFNTKKMDTVYDNVIYTDLDVLKNQNSVSFKDFPKQSQVKLSVSNYSNTSEDYKVLLTSNYDLSRVEDSLKVKINDQEFLLKDLKVADNYFLIEQGTMKASSKEIDIYFAIDEENEIIKNQEFYFAFVNDLTI